jgi:hypothetical protein
MDLLSRLKHDAYSELSASEYSIDIDGWMDKNFTKVVKNYLVDKPKDRPLTIIEVGSWKGKSASALATIVKELDFEVANIVCIDTWLGAAEFWTWGLDDKTRGLALNKVNGYPSVYYTFVKNMKALGHDDIVAPLPLSSNEAFKVLRHHNIKADVIYVDASHEFEAVTQDMANAWEVLSSGGLLIGDDYNNTDWPGVVSAVNNFGKAKLDGVVWSFKKP